MSKLARACAVAVAVATSLAGGNAAAQIQGGAARKAAPPAIALGVPGAKANISQRSSASARSGSSLSFASGQPALRYQAVDLPTAKDPVRREAVKDGTKVAHVSARGAAAAGPASTAGAGSATSEFAPAPGVLRANMPPVTFADAERVLKTRVLPVNVNQGVTAAPKTGKTSTLARMKIAGDAAASGPASIAELARSLRHHPDLIYQYVRNNVEYYPTYGAQKGALGAVLDNQATAHDQAALMVELLRASGLEANYVRGIAKLSAAQLAEWWGINTANACGVLSLLGQAQIPVYEINATTAGSCPGTVAALTDVSIEHVWVKTRINGSWYVFDPSYKPHTFKSGIDLATAAGYDAAHYLASARSGATVGTDYVQNINRNNIRFNLEKYAGILAGHLRISKPAATLDDVLGGKTIVPFYGALRQTSLPYQNTAWGSEELAELPGYMKPTLRVQYQGIDQTYTSDAIYGRRLTLTYNGANQPVLKLDGVAVGSPGTAVTPGTSTPITFTVTHNAYVSTWANHSFTQKIKGGGTNTFLIANGWGPAGRGPAENYRRTLSDLKASGAADASEPLLGSTLAVIGAQWIAQNTHAGTITERIADTTLLHQHQVGIVGYTGSAYVDLPSNVLAVANVSGNTDKESAAFANWASYGPYGEPNTTTGPRFRYTGQQLIGELGLYHYKARFYSPSLGRFLQTDPIGYKDDVNLYAYVGSNPANRTDPSGLIASQAAALAAGVGGASAFPVAPQSNVQGTSLGNWIDNSPIHDPPLEGVYPEQFLIGGGLGVLRGAAQAAAKGVATKETAALTEISFGAKATRNSANQLTVGLTQSQAIENLAVNGYVKTMSKDGTVTIMNSGDKTYRFYPQSTGGGIAGAPNGVPSASVSVLDEIITKLRFLGE